MNFEQIVAQKLAEMMNNPRFATQEGLNGALRLLAKWRSKLIDNTIVKMDGTVIQSGPFKGMQYVAASSEANVSAKLLGTYESGLNDLIERIVSSDICTLVDIGCSDGYYACGFAYRMPDLRVEAFDIDPVAQRQCSELAQRNRLGDRIQIRAEFTGSSFGSYIGRHALIFMDAEGIEEQLLDPSKFTALAQLPIIVECHDVFRAGLSSRLKSRFEATHDIEEIRSTIDHVDLPQYLQSAGHLDQLLAIWEWRLGPTPWLYLTPRRGAQSDRL